MPKNDFFHREELVLSSPRLHLQQTTEQLTDHESIHLQSQVVRSLGLDSDWDRSNLVGETKCLFVVVRSNRGNYNNKEYGQKQQQQQKQERNRNRGVFM